ncbi:MAG: hypothetical protein KDA84_13650 [Planctomycetaceae bacterium]|nr:hypothetical protein [Planctomycetaceae bacterium]
MLRFWDKASIGLALGLVVGGLQVSKAQEPKRLEQLQRETSQSPLVALDDEAFFPSARSTSSTPASYSAPAVPLPSTMPSPSPGYYCPPRTYGLPPMMGDFFPGYSGGARQTTLLERLLIVADDLDAPSPLPGTNQQLTITEPGPVGIFQTSVQTVQDIQALLRAGQPLPTPTQVGSVDANATVTTTNTVGQIQTLLSSTPGVAFDIIPVAAPPSSYQSAVDAVFRARNTGTAVTTFNSGASGALLQGGADTLDGSDLDAFYFYDYRLNVSIPTPSAGTGGVGRARIAENGTTIPQNRVFADFGYYSHVAFVPGGANLKRYTPGFETAFLDGMGSLEVRIPFATTVEDNIFENGSTSTDELHFGNIPVYAKFLLQKNEVSAISGGLGLIFPTADGFDVNFNQGGRLLEVESKSYHLQPFLGGYYAPSDRAFMQWFAQLDFDPVGNPVNINADGNGMRNVGHLYDSTYLFLDWSVGYWIMRGAGSPVVPVSSMTQNGQVFQNNYEIGLAPTVELHYAKALESTDSVSSGPIQVGNFSDDVETLTLVLGMNMEIGQDTNIGLGYATAIAGGSDKPFDGALRLTINQFFGRR